MKDKDDSKADWRENIKMMLFLIGLPAIEELLGIDIIFDHDKKSKEL